MARRWNKKEEALYRLELRTLYIKKNKTLKEVASILNIAEQTVFQRLKRLGIQTQPHLKSTYARRVRDVRIPKYSIELAELFGILLGDGHISHFQVVVSLGTKEMEYTEYVKNLMSKIFGVVAKILIRKTGYRDVYFGSVQVTSWLLDHGLVNNKVVSQVDIPTWIFSKRQYMEAFLRGFFDTDGSIYRLKFGIQISFTNYSLPLLKSLHKMLSTLGYKPSKISSYRVYLTRINDIKRFFEEIGSMNKKHVRRFQEFVVNANA